MTKMHEAIASIKDYYSKNPFTAGEQFPDEVRDIAEHLQESWLDTDIITTEMVRKLMVWEGLKGHEAIHISTLVIKDL